MLLIVGDHGDDGRHRRPRHMGFQWTVKESTGSTTPPEEVVDNSVRSNPQTFAGFYSENLQTSVNRAENRPSLGLDIEQILAFVSSMCTTRVCFRPF